MPADLNFEMYFNIAFLSALGLGVLFGFLRGFRNSLWTFMITLIFFAFFFLTIDRVVNLLWDLNMPFLGGALGGFMPSLSSASTISEAVFILLEGMMPDDFLVTLTNEHFIELATSIGLFVIKIVYTLLYFTVVQLVYRLLLMIIKFFIFPSKKKTDKYKSKNRGMGALIGLLQGSLSVYVTLIIFGGIMSIGQSVAGIMPEADPGTMNHVEFRYEVQKPTTSIIEMSNAIIPTTGTLDESVELLNNMVDAYNANPIVVAQNTITMTSPYDETEQMPLSLYLFDSVLSMTYQEEQIAIRYELGVVAEAASDLLASDFIETQHLNDIQGDDIRNVFNSLSSSNLITTILPVAIEVASEAFDTPLEMELAALYDIAWDEELSQLGEVAATAFDILNAVGALDGTVNLETVTLDGDDVQALFNELGDSQLVTLAAFVAIDPLLEQAGDDISLLITVPEDINWRNEFRAIGALAGSVLNAGLTVGDIQSNDINAILSVLGNVDFTLIMDSDIITNAMINILSGNVASIPIPAMITIPADIEWFDTIVDGVTVRGELFNILTALNALADSASTIDFANLENLNLTMISEFTADDINSLFESKILVATITSFIRDLNLGDGFTIIMPDTVFDTDGYIFKTELQHVVDSVFMLVTELSCPVGDTECEAIGVDINKIFSLDGENIDTLLESEVLAASAGHLILELGSKMLTVPGSTLDTIQVDGIDTSVVSNTEIKNAFLAISALGIEGIDNLDISPDILTNLAVSDVDDPLTIEDETTTLDTNKSTLLFGSKILNATLSKYLLEYANEEGALVVVPYFEADGTTLIRISDPIDSIEYISETELTNILKAVLVLDLDFENIDQISIANIMSNTNILLGSSILHATVSNLLLEYDDVIVVPLKTQGGEDLKITVGTDKTESFYIKKTELEAAFDALDSLGLTDFENMAIDITLLNNLESTITPNTPDTTKTQLISDSSIINATLANYLLKFSEGEGSIVVVPYRDELGNVVRTKDAEGISYISNDEINRILEAVFVLEIEDFNDFSTFEISTIIEHSDVLLGSAILHATVSKQLFNLTDVIIVPSVNALDQPIRVKTGDPIFEAVTEYITKAELLLTFDALEALGITNITSPDVGISLLNDLAISDVDNPLTVENETTTLDTSRSDIYFDSTIINATLSKFIIDLAVGDSAFIVIPEVDELGATVVDIDDGVNGTDAKIITEAELTNILKAVLKLGFTEDIDVSGMSLDTIMPNISYLLDSAILQASVSKMLVGFGTDTIVIPSHYLNGDSLIINQASFDGTVQFIESNELLQTFEALNQLGIGNLSGEGVAMDLSLLNSLGKELAPTELDPLKSAELFQSTIISATLSKYLIKFSSGENDFLVVPYINEDDVYIRVTSTHADATEYITEAELTNVLKAVLALDLQSFDTSSFNLQKLLDNKEVITGSCILQATISEQVISLSGETVIIPEQDQDLNDVIINKGVGLEESSYLSKAELSAVLDAMGVLVEDTSGEGISGFSATLDFEVLKVEGAVHTLVQSAMLQATISKQIFDIAIGGGTTLVIVPYRTPDNNTDLRITVGTVETLELIENGELENLIEAFLAMGFDSVDDMGAAISIQNLADHSEEIFESYVIQATVSNQVVGLESTTVIVPYFDEDLVTPTQLRFESGPDGSTTKYIATEELEALLDALLVLSPDSSGGQISFGGDVDVSLFYEVGPRTTLLTSNILQATISEKIIKLGTAIEIPLKDEDGIDVKLVSGDSLEGTENTYISEAEIHDLFIALEVLELSNIGDFDGDDLSFSKYLPSHGPGYDDNQEDLLGSACIQATVSSQIIELEGSGYVVIPSRDYDLTDIEVSVSGTDYIKVLEIKHLFNALDILGVDINNFNGSLGLTNLFESSNASYDSNQDILLDSAIMHATVSSQINNLTGSNAIIIPSTDVLDVTFTNVIDTVFFIEDLEIKHLLNAMDALGFGSAGNLSGFGGAVSFESLADPTKQTVLLDSIIMHRTLSDKIYTLSTGGAPTIIIPTTDFDELSIHTTVSGNYFIDSNEIKALFTAMNALGITGDVTTFDGGIGLGNLFASEHPLTYSDNQTDVLNSAIMHRTISNQINNLGAAALIIPTTDIDNLDIDKDALGNFYFTSSEIKHLIDAMDVLGVNPVEDLGNFDGSINLSKLGDNASQNKLLLSAIMHATLSDKLFDSALDIPDIDINRLGGAVTIRVTQHSIEFLEKIETKLLLNSLFEMNMTDFGNMTPSLATILSKDMDIILGSVSMQTTVSQEFLATAKLYAPANAGDFIVPNAKRENITINTVAKEMIEVDELKALMNSLDDLGMHTFNVSISGNSLNGKTYSELMTIFESASMHLTAELMIQENAGINTFIPDITGETVIADSLYGETNIITDVEVARFIVAVGTFNGSLDGSFDSSVLGALTNTERLDVITSAIARCKLTPEFVTAMAINLTPYGAGDYETIEAGSPICLTYDAAEDALALY